MTAPSADLDTALAAVPAALDAVGYADFCSAHFPHQIRFGAWQRSAQLLDGPLRDVVGVFLLNERVSIDALPGPVAAVLPALADGGVARLDDAGHCWLAGLILVYTRGAWLFVQPPQPSPTLYLGDDSLALADKLILRSGPSLDLCAGPGVQSLLCALRGHQVTAVEINPVAAALCRVNVALNDLADRVTVRCGNLYSCVPEAEFGNIVANPPLLPIPAGVPYPFIGDGGPDGLRVTRDILDGLPRHLAPDGQACLIGMALSDGILPRMLDELAEFGERRGLTLTVTVTAHIPVGPRGWWAEGVSQTAARHAAKPREAMLEALCAGYAALDASHVCTYTLRARRGPGELRYIDLSAEEGGLWFV